MADKYTELITKVNKAIDPIENGAIVVAKAAHAVEAESAENAGNSGSATHADHANSVGSATFATAVVNMNIPLTDSDNVVNSSASGCFLEDGVYLVVYRCHAPTSSYLNNACGVLVVKAGVRSQCRISSSKNYISGAGLVYNPTDGSFIILCYRETSSGSGSYYEGFASDCAGVLYFYKFGTLEQEEV